MSGASLVLVKERRYDCYSRKAAPQAEVTPLVTDPIAPIVVEEPVKPVEVAPEPELPAAPVREQKQYIETFGNKSVFEQGHAQIKKKVFKVGYDKLVAEMTDIINNQNGVIESVCIRATSSPEGPESRNLVLATQRGEVLRTELAKGLGVEASDIGLHIEAENWKDFIEVLNQLDWANKQEILDIIANNEDLDTREAALRAMPDYFYYNRIQQEFHNLRNCEIMVKYSLDATK